MLGTSPTGVGGGGIKSVVNVYQRSGLFARWPVCYITTVQPGGNLLKLKIALSALARFAWLLVTKQVSIVHAHTASRASFWRKSLFLLLAFAARRPVILHLHGAEFRMFYEDESGRLAKWFIRTVFNRATRIIVLSGQWKRTVARISTNQHVVQLFNPVETQEGPLARQRQRRLLLFLGELGRRKGIFDLLTALARLKTEFPDVILKVGGNGDVESARARARQLGIDGSVDIMGWVAGETKQQLLDEAAIYVLPSYNEGLPMALLEAMAAGLPVVSTPVGGIPDAVENGVEGYLVAPGDIDALVEAIAKLLRDPEHRNRMGRAATERILRDFTAKRIVPQVEALYRELGVQRTQV